MRSRGVGGVTVGITLPLSEDERAVLMIASAGQSMIPIGRWERPVLSLAAKGYLRKLDDVNFEITDAGRAASLSAEREVDARLLAARGA